MPTPPRRSALIGEQFHAWLERRARAHHLLEEPTAGPVDPRLQRLIDAFEAGPYATDPVATEVRHASRCSWAGRWCAAGSTPCSPPPTASRWWTGGGRAGEPDPLQLALYRLAWSELGRIAVEKVDAVFYDVPARQGVRPGHLPGRLELEQLVGTMGVPR